LKVNVDDSSIEIATNALQVKASGVTNAMLAGSITDDKLSTIETADKVNWVAVNKTGSVLDDIADVDAPTPSDDQALAWDDLSSKWIPQTLSGGGGVVNAAITDVDVYSAGTTDAQWSKMPAAETELFGSSSSRIKLDLTYATHYRLVVNQTVAGYTGADLNLQYSSDDVTYQAVDTAAAGELDVGDGIGVKVGTWAEIVAGAQSDVWIMIVGKDGDGHAGPRWRQIRIQFKMLSTGGAAPTNAQYITLAVNGTLSEERVLTGTAGQITVTDGGAGSTATLALVNYNDSNWDDAYGWGDHAGLYDDLGTADANMALHRAEFDHNDIATAIQSADLDSLAELTSQIADVTAFITDVNMPAPGTDPDVSVSGQIAVDTDGANEPNDVILRTASVSGNQQYALFGTHKVFIIPICEPDNLAEADFMPIFVNRWGMTFNITKITGQSNIDNFTFTLKERDADGQNVTTIEAVTLSTDGTDMYYGSVAEADIDHTVIEADHSIGYVKSADDATYVTITIEGWFDADVD
jgi:hypothetical protein